MSKIIFERPCALYCVCSQGRHHCMHSPVWSLFLKVVWQENQKFQVVPSFIVSSRPSWDTWDHVSKHHQPWETWPRNGPCHPPLTQMRGMCTENGWLLYCFCLILWRQQTPLWVEEQLPTYYDEGIQKNPGGEMGLVETEHIVFFS